MYVYIHIYFNLRGGSVVVRTEDEWLGRICADLGL